MQTPRSTVWAVITGAHHLIHAEARLANVGAHLRATIVAAVALVSSALNDGLRCVRGEVHAHPMKHSACGDYRCASSYH